MNSEIDREADKNWRKGDGKDVEMADDRGGECHCIGKADHQTDRRFEGPSCLVVAVDENERDDDQGNHRCLFSVTGRLRHFIQLQNWFAGDSHIQTGHLKLSLCNQLPQPRHRFGIEIIPQRAGRNEIDPSLGEGDIDLPLSFFSSAEQRIDPG